MTKMLLRILSILISGFKSNSDLVIENMALRQQLAVFKNKKKRLTLRCFRFRGQVVCTIVMNGGRLREIVLSHIGFGMINVVSIRL